MGSDSDEKGRPALSVAIVRPPPGVRGSRIEVEGQERAVLSFPLQAPSLPTTLSTAEGAVALALVQGRSNREIAAARRTSVRTVANQIVAIYRKVGVNSRKELVVALAGPRGAGRPTRGRP